MKFTRMARLSAVPLGVTGRLARAGGLRVLGRLTDESSLELHERTADQLFEVLGGLKGGVMKFGQVLSVYETVLPPSISAVYRSRLTALQEAARPESAAKIRRVLEEDLGPHWRGLFAFIDDEPVAVASLGQVHRARWNDGREAAVKIQYPDARADLLSDRAALVLAMRLFTGLVAPRLDGRALAEGLMDRMAEELDYTAEARAQTAFHRAFDPDPGYRVPAVIAQSDRVLISEWLDGTPLSEVIATGSRADRDRAGLLLTRLMFAAPDRCGLMHGDPHPGNFRLRADGSLGVLDFGAVHRVAPGTESPLHKWMRIHLARDSGELVEILREVGFLPPGGTPDPARLTALFEHSGAPARTELFRFDAAYLRGTLDHLTTSMPVALSLAFPPDFVQAQRAIGVTIGVLCQLEAEVPFLAEGTRWLTPTGGTTS